MQLQFIKHHDILFRDLLRVIAIKSNAWPYPIESQIRWMLNNLQDEDIHVILHNDKKDMGYLTLSNVTAKVDNKLMKFTGVGCVCVANPGKGWGKSLIINTNEYLQQYNCKGLLFCKTDLLGFYSKYNWKLIPPEIVFFNSPHEGVFTMVYNCEDITWLEYTDRFF